MIRNLLFAAIPVAALLSFAAAQDQTDVKSHGLMRVQPGTIEPRVEGSGAFDAEQWRERLTAVDLDARLRSFERLVRRGWRDQATIAFLRSLAADDEAELELRWTARLALRELERASRIVRPLEFFATPFSDRSGSGHEMFFGRVAPHAPFALHGPSQGSENNRSRRMSIEQDGELWKIKIIDTVDGEESVREYEGESLESIIEANPELADEMNVMPFDLGAGMRLELQGPGGGLMELFEGELGQFEHFRPLHPFEFKGADGTERRLRFLIQPQRRSRPLRTDVLGVRVGQVSEEHGQELGLPAGEGLYISSVLPGTLAHIMGLTAGGVLLEVNKQTVQGAQDITDALRSRAPRAAVEVVWMDALGERRSRSWKRELPDEGEDF